MKISRKTTVAILAVPVLMLLLAGAAFAEGGQELIEGAYTLIPLAGPPPPSLAFKVKQGGDRIRFNGQTYQWDGVDRYKDVRGSAGDGYICIDSDSGSGGFTYVPTSGTPPPSPSACAY